MRRLGLVFWLDFRRGGGARVESCDLGKAYDVVTKSAADELLMLTQRIREEFQESPGLRLSVDEGARFWGLDETVCELVLSELMADGFLSRGRDYRFRQASIQ